MNETANNPAFSSDLLEAQGPCTTPLDMAVEYIRARIDRVLPMYVLAMARHAVITVLLIDAVTGERRRRIATYCLYLVACMVWRWIWLSRLQYGVQADLQDNAITSFWRRLPQVLLVRLFSHFAITWGGFLVGVPVFYGIFTGSFAAPLLFENDEPLRARLRRLVSWIQYSAKRLMRVVFAMTVLACIMTVAVFVSQAILTETFIPSLLGLNIVDLGVTLASWGWRLRMIYFIFLVLDAFWTVAAVFLYYDSQSRRMATDLRARLQLIAHTVQL